MGEEGDRASIVADVLADLVGREATASPTLLPGGFANETWLIDVGDGRLLLRVAPADADPIKVRAAWHAHQMAFEAGVRTGQPLAYVDRCAPLERRAVRVAGFVDGVLAEGTIGSSAPFFAALGKELARLHRIALPAFSSRVDGSAPSFDTWGEYVDYRIPAVRQRAVTSGALSEREAEAALSEVAALAHRVSEVVTPSLTHRDLHLRNVVAGPDGELRAIVDWDAAEAWDPVVDLVKLRWQVFDTRPGAGDSLLAAYEDTMGVLPLLRERLVVVDALELTNNLANARLDGHTAYEAHNRRALAAAIAAR